MSENEKKKTRNVFILGGAFGLIFTGFLTIAATAETILRSYQKGLSFSSIFEKKIVLVLNIQKHLDFPVSYNRQSGPEKYFEF